MKTESINKELIKSAGRYYDDLLKKAKDWHKGQHVGQPQTVKEINAQVQGFEDGYNHAMSFIESINKIDRAEGDDYDKIWL